MKQVTTDPEATRDPVKEGSGTVLSDSLAGESIASGGAFATKNPGVGVDPQPAHGTTTNTTDTSSARELPPAANAASRSEQSKGGGRGDVSSGAGAGTDVSTSNSTSTSTNVGTGTVGGNNSSFGPSSNSDGGSGNPSGAASTTGIAGTAPTYVNAAQQGRNPNDLKPKGNNIQEGGFEGNEPNASLGQAGTDNIGSENDPGRVAEQKLQSRTAEAAAGSAAGSRDMKSSGAVDGSTGGYDALVEEKLE